MGFVDEGVQHSHSRTSAYDWVLWIQVCSTHIQKLLVDLLNHHAHPSHQAGSRDATAHEPAAQHRHALDWAWLQTWRASAELNVARTTLLPAELVNVQALVDV